jgi:hypothetical protein
VNGAPLADRLYLRFWDDVLYDQKLAQVDCSEHTYPIAHAAPGWHVSYTVFVSIIPIVFEAGVDLDLTLEWGWKICDDKIYAEVEIEPSASVVLSGSAVIDLLILQAGLELSGAISQELIPQAYIDMSECLVGFDVEQKSNPWQAKFDAYYAWADCKILWIFDCTWGKHNEYVFWEWDQPSVDKIIYKEEWPIIKP